EGIFWLRHKKLHLTQLGVQLLGCSPVIAHRRAFLRSVVRITGRLLQRRPDPAATVLRVRHASPARLHD
ncbi:hypothetical protein D6D38_07660, partial [Rahnella variigena]